MRPVGLGDLVAAAGALAAVPPARRGALMVRLLAQAQAADAFRRREGRMHPVFGNGTLMAAALACPQAAPPPGGVEALAVLAEALEGVLAWHKAREAGREG
jgi:hypothetical protein